MAFDEGLAQLMRDDLAGERVTERKMFGGLAFLLDGHMVCGVHGGGAMFRVGKANEAAALAVPGAAPMAFTGRKMGGMIDLSDEAAADDARRGRLMTLALAFAKSLPPKEPR
ncbi:TfoX/Sxy family protein [Defluviimonas sp. WL0024]|uniref:TfoX/Sxy family protein n=1 Tax=Albidovulum salinarum TaxID=2984153 RepID=A0ABT2X3Z1_9RHOB|nr:TfoX/Sxy family protein [Defluviimonas sp. WL0024]MCU9848667.1 TfoX/Sxy family protein [Defluviimonas sp. WL0024]